MENKPFNINEWLPVKIEDRRQKTEEGRPNADSRLLNADSRLLTPDSRLLTADSRLLTADSRLPTPDSQLPIGTEPQATHNIEQDIELVTASLERAQYDLTADYNNWLQIGFGLANELGELGRSYFHRISRFNPKYTIVDTDKKYDSCLKNLRTGTTIKTFFYFAKQADIDINKQKKNNPGFLAAINEEDRDPDDSGLAVEEDDFSTPLLPAEVFENMPRLLTDCCSLFADGIEKDIFLLSAITVLSACLPNIEGIYFNRRLSAHLFLFITGPSASGKGTMVWSRYLANEIHSKMYAETMLAQSEYLKELGEYENLNKNQKVGLPKPEEPPRRMFFIPANSSSAALTQLLAENNFRGIIFESEADTLSNTAKQDWGDSSDIFRKAFHHENTSMARRTNKEFIEIKNPHLAMCLSGTPKQVHNLMPEVENGLFSRFMYYAFQDTRGFLNPFVSYQPINYDYFFTQRSYEVYHLFEKLSKLKLPVLFELTEDQGLRFTKLFQSLLEKNKMLLSRDLDANTKRLGLITFRIAMVLTALRLMEIPLGTKIPPKLICSDNDFNAALTVATTLESHAVAVYQQMPKVDLKGLRLSFFEKLPKIFNRQDYLNTAKQLGIAGKTADKYISLFKTKLLDHNYNEYSKIHA